jgi:hypothetical protein
MPSSMYLSKALGLGRFADVCRCSFDLLLYGFAYADGVHYQARGEVVGCMHLAQHCGATANKRAQASSHLCLGLTWPYGYC